MPLKQQADVGGDDTEKSIRQQNRNLQGVASRGGRGELELSEGSGGNSTKPLIRLTDCERAVSHSVDDVLRYAKVRILINPCKVDAKERHIYIYISLATLT